MGTQIKATKKTSSQCHLNYQLLNALLIDLFSSPTLRWIFMGTSAAILFAIIYMISLMFRWLFVEIAEMSSMGDPKIDEQLLNPQDTCSKNPGVCFFLRLPKRRRQLRHRRTELGVGGWKYNSQKDIDIHGHTDKSNKKDFQPMPFKLPVAKCSPHWSIFKPNT